MPLEEISTSSGAEGTNPDTTDKQDTQPATPNTVQTQGSTQEVDKPEVVLTRNGNYVERNTAIWDYDSKEYIDGPDSKSISPENLGNYTPGAPIEAEQLSPTINSNVVVTADRGYGQREKTSFDPETGQYEKTQLGNITDTQNETVKTKDSEQKQYYGENPENLKKKVDSHIEYMAGEDKKRYEEFQDNSGPSQKPDIMDPESAKSTNSITDDSEITQRYQNTKTEPKPEVPQEITTEQEDSGEKLETKDLVALMTAITELNTSIVELKKVFEGNDLVLNSIEKLSITVNNYGNQIIVNNGEIQIGTQTNIDVQGEGNETNVNINTQPTAEETYTSPQEDNLDDIPEETSVEDLQKQKSKLEEQLKNPNLTQEQYNTLNITIGKLENVINISLNGAGDVELTDEEKEEKLEEQEKAAEYFLNDKLTDQDKSDLKEAGESDKGFFAQIKRVFKGSGWKKFITEGAKRFGANLAISSAVGGTVALLGPVGATMVGGTMAVMGGVTLYKGIKMVKAEAKATGKSVREVWQDKNFRKGVLHGTLTSGVGRLTTMAVSGLIPGVGGFVGASIPALASAAIGTGLEQGVEFFAEKDFQKKQKDFMDGLSSNFNYRNYSMMVDEGYLIDGTEIQGTKTLNVGGISENLRNIESIQEKDKANFAVKSGVATLLELYNQTGDDRFRYIEYTDAQYGTNAGYGGYSAYGSGQHTQTLDLTKIGLQEIQGESTDEYPLLEFEPPIDAYIDRINTQQLADKIDAGWASIQDQDVENLGLRIIQNIASLESAEVDSVLSEEKRLYYEKVRYMSGWRMGTCVVNAASSIGAGISIANQGISAGIENRKNTQAIKQEIEQTRTEIGDNDAGVEIMQTENDEKVYAIDLDNDSNVDIYRTESGEMYSTSILGAEKSFEISNGLSDGDVSVTSLGNSQTGIAGTIVDNNTGQVLGVAIDGGNGTWTSMSVNELEAPLSATVAGSNQSANINITNVQPNGIATINIDGNTYETNLTTLNDIPSLPGTEGVPGGGTVNIENGDSMPVILRKAFADAAQNNEKLAEAYANDQHAMERKLYQGNYHENDATIRNEVKLTNPLRTDNNEGVFEYQNSGKVMEYLQELNGGNPVVLPGGTQGTPGQPGYNLGFNTNVNNPAFGNLTDITVPEVKTDIPAGGALTSLAALGLANLFDREPHVMTRKTTVTEADPQHYQPEYYNPYNPPDYYGNGQYGGEYNNSESDGTTPYSIEYNPDSPLFENTTSQIENNTSYVNLKIKKAFSEIFKSPPQNGYNRSGWRDRNEVRNDASPEYLKKSKNSEQILRQYLDRQEAIFPEYREAVSEIASKIKPISNECQVSIAIPALGEGASMRKTLEQFAKLESPEKFEVCILDTYPINSQDRTEEIVKEFSKNNPSLNIVYIKREVEANTNVGESRKFLSDIILERVSRIHDKAQRDDYVIVSQDADLQVFENTDYIDRILNHFEREEDSEVLLGRSNLSREALVQAPSVLAAWRAWYTFDLITNRETDTVQKTLGTNSAIKATTLAGIGGYNPFLKLAEDLDIGWKVGMLRNKEATKYSPGIGLQGEARRALVAKLNNVPIVNMYNNFHQNADIRDKDWQQIINENPKKFEFDQKDFEKELTALYKHAKSLPTIRNNYNTIFNKTMYALGVQYHIENDEVIIDRLNKNITDVIEKEKAISDQEQQ